MTKRTRRGLVAVVIVVFGFSTMSATVQSEHLPEVTTHCTYEVGTVGTVVGYTHSDPTGATADGFINLGGCSWAFRPQENMYSAVTDSMRLDGERTLMQFSIIDDVFGNAVGAAFCVDIDGNAVCGEEGSPDLHAQFCGTSPVFEAPKDTNGDGHKDFGIDAGLWLNGPVDQGMFCDPTVNPVGATSGGILNPNGGIFMMLSG